MSCNSILQLNTPQMDSASSITWKNSHLSCQDLDTLNGKVDKLSKVYKILEECITFG